MADALRMAVIGHVEWVEFALVERVPQAGEIVHATRTWQEPAGGGAVAAVQLLKLAGNATFYTALSDDGLGRKALEGLEALGVHVEAVFRPATAVLRLHRCPRGTDDHPDRRAHGPGRDRRLAVGSSGGDGRRLFHGRRRRSAPGRADGARPGGDVESTAGTRPRGRAARCSGGKRQ